MGANWMAGLLPVPSDFGVCSKPTLVGKRWGGRPHSTASCARMVVLEPSREEASMEKISIVGLDLAKNTIQLHAACADGSVSLRRRISRGKLLQFLSTIDRCTVAMKPVPAATTGDGRLRNSDTRFG